MELAAWLNMVSPDGPCFDPVLRPIPGSPVSLAMIDALCEWYVRERAPEKLRILEIGSFVGSSAIAWGSAARAAGVGDWKICCCDAWHHFDVVRFLADQTVVVSTANAFNHEIFKHNVKKAIGFDNVVELIGMSQDTLPLLADASFDLIYIDGYHGYHGAASDIRQALRLCRPGGIVCGDDYDCTLNMVMQVPEAEHDEDHQFLDGFGVHAGVARAVQDYLGLPKVYGTFWAFEKQADGMEAFDVPSLPRRIPAFVPEALHESFRAMLSTPHGHYPGHPFSLRHGD